MGSSSSKTRRVGGESTASLSSSSSSSPSSSFSSSVLAGNSSRRREKSSKTRRIFGSSCLGGSSSRANDSDDEHEVSGHGIEARGPRIRQTEPESDEVKVEHYQTVKVDGSDEVPRVSSNVELGDWSHASRTDNVTRVGGSSSQSLSGRSFNNSSRFLSRFSFVPESVSFRLSRAASVGSSRAYPSSPTSFAVSSAEDDLHLRRGSYGLINRNENQQIGSVNSSCPSSSSARNDDSIISLMRNDAVSSPLSTSLQRNRVISAEDLADDDSERIRPDDGLTPFGSHLDIGGLNPRLGDHRNGTREHVDRNVLFSRTLSVGRLRDRVLRRSSFSDMALSPSQNEGTTSTNEHPVSSLISSPYPLPSTRNPFHTNLNNDEISHLREARRHDLLEHRSNFLERRRRIRSQVRALQRLGSRFENLSGHDRYCILSGQHRTGRCSCHPGTRDSNSNDDGVARGSISRIVMLAEALFEVLDEIHQQSVALSSRPSVSSIGSVPAPNEVVESLPVRVYSKKTKVPCEDVAQCYICLVEYDEGDDVRILPCHHEFHKKCIDKWLKEIHRVCPLCRGDICRLESSSVES